jgi:hypothetical protein
MQTKQGRKVLVVMTQQYPQDSLTTGTCIEEISDCFFLVRWTNFVHSAITKMMHSMTSTPVESSFTLSDIMDVTGRWITEEAIKGKPLTDRHSPLLWPRRPSVPDDNDDYGKRLFRRYLPRRVKNALDPGQALPSQVWR